MFSSSQTSGRPTNRLWTNLPFRCIGSLNQSKAPMTTTGSSETGKVLALETGFCSLHLTRLLLVGLRGILFSVRVPRIFGARNLQLTVCLRISTLSGHHRMKKQPIESDGSQSKDQSLFPFAESNELTGSKAFSSGISTRGSSVKNGKGFPESSEKKKVSTDLIR